MQVKLQFNLENSFLPIEYRSSILSFFKSSLNEYDEEIYHLYYDKEKNKSKSYTFSVVMPKPIFNTNLIEVKEKKFDVFFSTYDYKDLIVFYNSFIGKINKKFSLNNNSMTLYKLTILKEKIIDNTNIIIKFCSPMILKKHDKEKNTDWYVSYEDEDFIKMLRMITQNNINNQNLNISIDDLDMIPLKPKKIIVKLYNKKVQTNAGIYQLKGNVDLLNFLKMSGVGSQRNSGFGYFEVIG